jgi:hypothetical protein
VSLDAREQRALNSIAESLTASAPEFVSRLLVFNRLTSGEQLPEGLQAKVKERHGHEYEDGHGHGRHRGGRSSLAGGAEGNRGPLMRPSHGAAAQVLPVVAALAVTIAVMITLALVLSATSSTSAGIRQASHCAQGWPIPCSGR